MTPHAVKREDIPGGVLKLFREMRNIVEEIPDIEGEMISCHSICQALAELFHVTHHEGKLGMCSHSWLRSKTNPAVLMDMYPIAGAASFIIFTDSHVLPWPTLYEEQKISYDKDTCQRQVLLLIEEMERSSTYTK
jgi:hypothetical protein